MFVYFIVKKIKLHLRNQYILVPIIVVKSLNIDCPLLVQEYGFAFLSGLNMMEGMLTKEQWLTNG